MIDRVAILGCGPAGLLAAQAAESRDAHVDIFSLPRRSVIGGAQYIHFAIPDVTRDEPDGYVIYKQTGTREGYAVKVYGDPNAPVSWDNYPPGRYDIWNMSYMYDILWRRFGDRIMAKTVDSEFLDKLLDDYPLVVSSVPKIGLCYRQGHEFRHQSVWIDHRRMTMVNPNIIHYNGDGSTDWYRYSCLFGWQSWEFSFEPTVRSPQSKFIEVKKPLSTTCDCWTDRPNLLVVGRYGRWEKAVLAHQAFFETNHHMWEHVS